MYTSRSFMYDSVSKKNSGELRQFFFTVGLHAGQIVDLVLIGKTLENQDVT